MFPALVLSLLALASPRIGPELTFADLRPAPPNNSETLLASWTENGTPVAVVARTSMSSYQTVSVRLRADGTADPASLTPWQIPSAVVGAARAGDGMLAVWRSANGLYASRVGSNGALFTPTGKLIEDGPGNGTYPTVTCGEVRCLATGTRSAMILALDGTLLTAIPSVRFAVAANRGFLVKRCESYLESSCRIEVLDDDGAVRSAANQPIQTAIFDGTRYVALSWSDDAGKVNMLTINPATAAWSGPVTIATFPSRDVTANLGWNGSIYLLTMQIAYKQPPFPAIVPAPEVATMRFDRTFAAVDAAPRQISQNGNTTPPKLLGVAGGFILFPYGSEDARQRANVLRDDGTLTPAPPASTALFQGLASQYMVAAAASPEAILGVWWEHEADRYALRAARLTHGGTRIDSTPLALSNAAPWTVRAASDGSGFAVVRLESSTYSARSGDVVATVIDAAGHTRTTTIEKDVAAPLGDMSLNFVNGAYQLALATGFGLEAVTISAAGDVVAQTRFNRYDLAAGVVSFDGRRLIAVKRSSGTTMDALVQEVPGANAEWTPLLNAPDGATFAYYTAAMAADGAGGYLLLVVTDESNHPTSERHARYVMRMSGRGELLTRPYDHLLGRGLFSSDLALARAGAGWLASWMDDTYATTGINQPYRVLAPFDGATLEPGALMSLPIDFPAPAHPVDGRPGEALLLITAPVPAGGLPVGRATVRTITLGGRGRAAGH